ncbi:phosphotransferase family protein [Pontibacillus marinus]|uniref:Aminoglycoside phosphotransferase n=1 Tax=Pontibacillus marinus BH030004 = DSM 16465 TaxID=1385511 RepID=A0A0A5GIG8_9BACI|nr:aminoglycoside phosphotransferase family protein [Pontibacillus marinus]KGX91824.1 aminoglycoside phosphotransferase [Pontibacillus marinus BH030004 = DSM 16465]
MGLGSPIAKGNTAMIYLQDEKIVKVYNHDLPNSESQNEAFKQRYAYSCGLSVPKILDITKIEGKQALVMEYVKGTTMGDLLFNNKGQAKYYLDLSIDIQQNIHSKPADVLEPMTEKLERQIRSAPYIASGVKTALIEKLHSMSFENRLCHGDFHVYNLILSEDNVTIIDWVDSSAGDIRADVYRSYLLYSQVSEELAELYVSRYCEKSGLSRRDMFEWAPIVAAARLAENVSTEDNERLLEIVEGD